MAWRNIEIDHLIIGYLMRSDDGRSNQVVAPLSGASGPRCSLTRTSASIQGGDQESPFGIARGLWRARRNKPKRGSAPTQIGPSAGREIRPLENATPSKSPHTAYSQSSSCG